METSVVTALSAIIGAWIGGICIYPGPWLSQRANMPAQYSMASNLTDQVA